MRIFRKRSLGILVMDLVVWIAGILIFVVLRFAPTYTGPDLTIPDTEINLNYYLLTGLEVGIVLGLVYGMVDIFLDQRWLRKRSYGTILITKGIIHFVVIVALLILIRIDSFDKLGIEITRENVRTAVLSPNLLIVLGYTTLVSFFLNFSRQIQLKFGPGNLWKFLIGRFHHPKEEERIFMFLDMKSSTTIAEKLGHVKFGELVQDCFSDLSIVRNRRAEVYQYVGDEAILYWEVEKGLQDANCLMAFFEFNELLSSRADYYLEQYGLQPEFKAGANIGPVTVTEIGDIKRDISFLGDTMNTAARIEAECNKHHMNLMISESLNKRLPNSKTVDRNLVDHLNLRGKEEKIGIYSVALK